MSWSESILVGSFCAPIKKFTVDESCVFQYKGEIDKSGPSPSYIIQSPCKQFIYCTVETAESNTSRVMSFLRSDGLSFELLSSQPAGGGAPCFLSVTPNNTYLIVSNYFGGNVTVFPICSTSGMLLPQCQEIFFNTTLSPHLSLNRDSGHCHQTVHLAKSQKILLCELGQNAVHTLEFTPQVDCDGPHDVLRLTGYWLAPAGSGPRHLVVHPSEMFVYVLSELSCIVTVLHMNPSSGLITSPSAFYDTEEEEEQPFHWYSTLRESEQNIPPETICAAEILLSDDARFLYISNRDVDVLNRHQVKTKFQIPTRCSVAVFAVQQDGAELQLLQHVSTLGCHPRALSFLNRGTHLAIANKDEGYKSKEVGGNLVVFPIDQVSGLLVSEGAVVTEDIVGVSLAQPTWLHCLSL